MLVFMLGVMNLAKLIWRDRGATSATA